MYRHQITCALIVACFALISTGADWTRFRGPEGTGVSSETGIPTTWSDEENVVWKTRLPGFGSSSPITLGEKIFFTCYGGYGLDEEQPGEQDKLLLHALCVDRKSGKILWQKTIEPVLPETPYAGARVDLHGYASATPVTDGQAVYVFFGKSGVLKYSLDGELLWHVSVGTGLDKHKWGSGASPILHGNLLIVNASCESQSVRALDKSSGKEVWRVDEIIDSWSTPLVVTTADGGEELVVIERFKVLGLDPATGKRLWFCEKGSDYICASVIANGDVIYAINSRMKAKLLAIRTGGRGNVTESHVLWTKNRWTTRVSTPVLHDGHLYAMDHLGVAYCLDATNGETVYREKLDISGGGNDKIYASLVVVDGKLYYVTRIDGTVVLALSPEFKELARNRLADQSVFNATPVVSDGCLLLRSDKYLYCNGKKN